jgi:hypothetical protein
MSLKPYPDTKRGAVRLLFPFFPDVVFGGTRVIV